MSVLGGADLWITKSMDVGACLYVYFEVYFEVRGAESLCLLWKAFPITYQKEPGNKEGLN